MKNIKCCCCKLKHIFLLVVLLISLLFIGRAYIQKSSEMTEVVFPKIYEFSLDGNHDISENMIFKDFRLIYSFSKNSGTISFVLGGYDKKITIQDITITVPLLINNSHVSVDAFNCSGNTRSCTAKSDVKYATRFINESNTSKTHIIFDDFRPFNKNEMIRFVVSFSSNIDPSGKFIFENSRLIHSNEYTLELDFGENYTCSFNCFEALNGIMTYDMIDKDIFVKFNDTTNVHIFKLNSINIKRAFLKELYMAIGVSLFVGVILLFLQFVYDSGKK